MGLFAGKFPGMGAVRNLREGWKVDCTHWIHRSGWIVFKFQSEEDRWRVLNGGPYFAYGRNLMLKSMPRCFRFGSEDLATVPVWIQLPDLPLDCWNARALSKIVSKVGKPISTDRMTRTKERISFARVLVEVDASKELITVVEVVLPTGVVYEQRVIFEVAPIYCKKCNAFGHGEVVCNKDKEGWQFKAYVPKRNSRPGGVDFRPLGGKQKAGEATAVKVGADLAVSGQPGASSSGPRGDRPGPTVGVVGTGPKVGAARGVQAAAAPPVMAALVAKQITTPLCPGEVLDSGDVGWTTVGKKGKGKKRAGQPGAAAVQQQPVGVGMQGGAQLKPVVVGSSGKARELHTVGGMGKDGSSSDVLGGQPGVAAVHQQPVGDVGLLLAAAPCPGQAEGPANQQMVGGPSKSVLHRSDGERSVTCVPDSAFYLPGPRWKGKGKEYGR